MTDAHQVLARIALAATMALLLALAWSLVTNRRSNRRGAHRFLVDRLVLAVLGLLSTNEVAGLALIPGGPGPADPLHFLYGPAALVALPIGVWLGRRGLDRAGSATRRDAWLLVSVAILLGLEVRLFMTG